MRAFSYIRAEKVGEAVQLAATGEQAGPQAPTQFLSGGTTILDLMKLDTMRPDRLVDLADAGREFAAIARDDHGLHLGAFCTMAQTASHPLLQDFPVIRQSLLLAASPQIRNMARLGGNVLQRTRCNYFRDASWDACNKRKPGSGCAALHGVNRKHAVLGTSPHCIATYAGDFAQALMALEARVQLIGPSGARSIAFEDLHVEPGDTPSRETRLRPGELIVGFTVPPTPFSRRSLYCKIRDRQSYEFALASAAVALDMDGDRVREARIALGGVATRPWRSREAEAQLNGRQLTPEQMARAADAAFRGAVTHGGNDYKPELGRRTLVRALRAAQALEV